MPVTTSDLSPAPSIFTPVTVGNIELANRIVMAPLTRIRAGSSGIPGDLMVQYYRQRASVGLIITEGTYPTFATQGWAGAPGIATDEQAAGWRRVFEAVHAEGGRIVLQIMDAGRATHPDINGGRRVLAPSAIALGGVAFTDNGKQPFPVPEAMTAAEAQTALENFVAAAVRAIEAGADGVEIHGANGYLLHQFLSPAANQRTDEYGGSPQNRARFVVDVVTAVAKAVGSERVGLRISPENNSVGDVFETDRDDVLATYGALLDQLRPLGLAYLSVLHGEPGGELVQELRRRFGGKLLVNSGFDGGQTTREQAVQRIDGDHADAVVVGRALIANPDLVERWQGGHPENEPRPELFYAPAAEGYTDYPFLQAY
ncbi:alkene reductase [Arthrobacter bambusae]|uniref:2,4-dienoyl-CoA reductase-like NADH-dependent reductase (Old Yellow Enzyme family) n=1 Tax=Arthrobacter bambusae TaxID=1338426 RepID=A0AAW8DFL3_9MICC|nr:alkene reductase [Arthrobacter bambusae]MDP9904686.1 2,4-dienoyl-CoA reductase-like NADH-dependent reductase (Old Yellow Enzyme family) [Arthrobacter bambusae]MDQ0129502.1 2,4-dienoyl-CoA reductase-like NADH-dependent reductase (Old Yellow Enzyme family) [Arthrobacter bambusae]MDQ0180885.1 2,4-dienoyl-CoA reductase-like NADH-dependent reductase (Old Yellow Enzyme family) [Arthrobacter bambusae]